MAHCVLNQNTLVVPLARAPSAYREIVAELMRQGIGIHQMPCPEYRYLGLGRLPMTKGQYDTPSFRSLTQGIAAATVKIMEEYLRNDYVVLGILGINQSPTCSLNDDKGIYMEELLYLLANQGIKLPLLDVPADYHDDTTSARFLEELRRFVKAEDRQTIYDSPPQE